MSHPHRLLLKWARYVHVYLTMFGLLIILFFAVTGFILNHPDWFDYNDKHKTVVEGNVPTGLLQEPDKLAIVELLRANYGARGALHHIEVRDDEIMVQFKCPGRESEAVIHLEESQRGQLTITHESRGLLGLLTDLHRGEASGYHTSEAWAWVIDGVAILMLVVSLTGLILWSSLRSRGQFGIIVMGLGVAVCVVVYFLYVP